MSPDSIRVSRVHPDAAMPTRAHADDAGLDLTSVETCTLAPGARATVNTGVAVEVPAGWVGLVCARSGIAARHGVGIVNGPGVVDSGYRGEVRVVLHNTDPHEAFDIRPGDRIAQLVLVPTSLAPVEEVESLDSTTRSGAGFGSTGGFG